MTSKRIKKYNKKTFRKKTFRKKTFRKKTFRNNKFIKSYNKKNLTKNRFINSYRKNYITKGGEREYGENIQRRPSYGSAHGKQIHDAVIGHLRTQHSTTITQRTVNNFKINLEEKMNNSFLEADQAYDECIVSEVAKIPLVEKKINEIKKNIDDTKNIILKLYNKNEYYNMGKNFELLNTYVFKLKNLKNLISTIRLQPQRLPRPKKVF